jgi:uncharacterized protein
MSSVLFERIGAVLQSSACDIGAAECHGILTGMLCGDGPFDVRTWLAHVSADDEGGTLAHGDARARLDELIDRTRTELSADDFSFFLLLPGDEAAIGLRAGAFADWCRGFLAGCALAGIVDLAALGEDGREFLLDVERFCRLGFDGEGGEDEERALTELIEFTRMGVLLLRTELRDRGRDGSGPPPALH